MGILPLFLCAAIASAASLNDTIEKLLATDRAAQGAHWGIHAVDLTDGRVVCDLNSTRLFVPASNMKLFATALALMRLGPEYRFRTTAGLEPGGDLVLTGGGDPSMSDRIYPYRNKDGRTGDPFAAIDDLAAQIVARGVTRIDGDIIGDDTRYVWEPYPEGWAQDDAIWEFGAPVSALTLNDNQFRLYVAPGAAPGEPASIELHPRFEYFAIDNRVTTVSKGGERKIDADRPAGTRQLLLRGTIPLEGRRELLELAVDDSAIFAATVLRDALTRRGVVVSGRAVARHRYPGESVEPPPFTELASHESPPLWQIVQVVNKVSQNLHAELCLREVSRHGAPGSRQSGLADMRAFLLEIGVTEREAQVADGSGLTRLALLAPAALTRLLYYMYSSPLRGAWVASLPVAAEDGTLATRFAGYPKPVGIRAKTGTMTHVSSLSGYTLGKRVLAFSIMVNNYDAPASEVRRIIDKIGVLLAEGLH